MEATQNKNREKTEPLQMKADHWAVGSLKKPSLSARVQRREERRETEKNIWRNNGLQISKFNEKYKPRSQKLKKSQA